MKFKVETTLSEGKITGRVIYPFSDLGCTWYRFCVAGSSSGLTLKIESVDIGLSEPLMSVIARLESGIIQAAKDMLMESIADSLEVISKTLTIEI